MLQSIGNSIGKFLREDEKMAAMQLEVHAHFCVEMNVSKPLLGLERMDSSRN